MKYNPEIHHRRTIRLRDYDYSQAGLYFITICTRNRLCLFGRIINEKMVLNDAGNAVNQCWHDIPAHYPDIQLHEFIIMPNHIHGIVGAEYFPPKPHHPRVVGQSCVVGQSPHVDHRAEDIPPLHHHHHHRVPLGNIVRGFKIGVTKWFQQNMAYPVGKSIWLRNYWERIIRNEQEHAKIAEYINNNPAKWDQDKLNDNKQSIM